MAELTYGEAVARGTAQAMTRDPDVIFFGELVKDGRVYFDCRVTATTDREAVARGIARKMGVIRTCHIFFGGLVKIDALLLLGFHGVRHGGRVAEACPWHRAGQDRRDDDFFGEDARQVARQAEMLEQFAGARLPEQAIWVPPAAPRSSPRSCSRISSPSASRGIRCPTAKPTCVLDRERCRLLRSGAQHCRAWKTGR